jgi:peptidoglycan biosynthesis protein MviN/MurJ (putative lipid II flippase)
MIVNIGLNLILIPSYQAFGSAIATLATQFLIAGVQVFVVYKLFKFRINYLLIFKIVVFLTGALLLGYFSKQTNLDWYINFPLFVILSLLLALSIRLVSLRYIYSVLKYGEKH